MNKQRFRCSICGTDSAGGSHSPHPIYDVATGEACGACNNEVVLPTRNLLRKRRAKVATMQARIAVKGESRDEE